MLLSAICLVHLGLLQIMWCCDTIILRGGHVWSVCPDPHKSIKVVVAGNRQGVQVPLLGAQYLVFPLFQKFVDGIAQIKCTH